MSEPLVCLIDPSHLEARCGAPRPFSCLPYCWKWHRVAVLVAVHGVGPVFFYTYFVAQLQALLGC